MNPNHQYCIITDRLLCPLTKNTQILINQIDKLKRLETDTNLNMKYLTSIVPPSTTRMILIYFQSFLTPDFPGSFTPHFVFESIYIHAKQAPGVNFVQQIYDLLSFHGKCFELVKSTLRMSIYFTMLLGDPSQRADSDFKMVV
jgi:hypothetical protein